MHMYIYVRNVYIYIYIYILNVLVSACTYVSISVSVSVICSFITWVLVCILSNVTSSWSMSLILLSVFEGTTHDLYVYTATRKGAQIGRQVAWIQVGHRSTIV